MKMADDHTCSYYCERPACVLAQRNELRDKYVVPVVRTSTIGTSDKPIDVWVGTEEVAGRIIIAAKSESGEPLTPWIGTVEPERLPPAPLCCCTEPPTTMGLTFYMDSSVGPVQRVDAACPACGAVVKGLKL